MKGQSRKHSLLESVLNVAIGYVISLCVQIIVYPLFGASFTFAQNLELGAIFTITSIIRNYWIRRAFNSIMIGRL